MKIDQAKERIVLKPCPFCGESANEYPTADDVYAGCNECEVSLLPSKVWNARAAQPVRVSREALRQALRSSYSPDVSHEDSVESAMSALGIEVTNG